jgi:antirestriction protein ArdC
VADEQRQYSPFIHLSTDVRQAGGDMIEQIGYLTETERFRRQGDYHRADLKSLREVDMSDLRKAVKAAADALRNYDALIAAGVEKSTREQFDDAAEVL